MGKLVFGRFFPFKTPLCSLYDNQIQDASLRFHPADAFDAMKRQGKKIGLWIDLTKTDRYYFKDEAEQDGCKYRKMALAGHKATPTQEEVDRFIRLTKGFLADNPDAVVGIHCTHGFNRTGFLICAYLCEVESWAPDMAIHAFLNGRPTGIYKQDYIDDLISRYGDPEERLQAPDRPAWEYNDSTTMVDAIEASASTSHTNGNDGDEPAPPPAVKVKQFMDGQVPGVSLLTDPIKRGMLQAKIKELCGYRSDGFPGSQPVSLARSPPENDNLKNLALRPYVVSWKADGMRYMVYIRDEDEIFAFDRDNDVFELPRLKFPHRKEPRHVQNTLVDCEVIIDKVKDQNGVEQEIPRLLIYDIIHFENFSIRKMMYDQRKECIKRELIEPRTHAFHKGTLRKQDELMSVRLKEFWEICSLPKFFEDKFVKNVGHEIDGLIFQPCDEEYKSGRQDSVLKWKPPSHNSIDFLLRITRVVKPGELARHDGLLYVQNSSAPFAVMKATKALLPYDGKIIECRVNEGNQWEFMRERTDKSLPNSFRTATAVANSMCFPVTQEMLCKFCTERGYKRRSVPANGEPPRKRPA
ncbi:unnamed protein product, partial [Mesorhabditis spiculigera]